MEACQQFLLVFTDTSRLCMWSLAGRQAKPYGGAGRVVDLPPDLSLLSMRCNCDGSKVSVLVSSLCDSPLLLQTYSGAAVSSSQLMLSIEVLRVTRQKLRVVLSVAGSPADFSFANLQHTSKLTVVFVFLSES